jgi:hypothetical protein
MVLEVEYIRELVSKGERTGGMRRGRIDFVGAMMMTGLV